MKGKLKVVFYMALASTILGCQTKPAKTIATPARAIAPLPAGMQCLLIPSEWNTVGTIFSVDNNGVSFTLGIYPMTEGSMDNRAATVPVQSGTADSTLGIFAKSLEDLSEKTGLSAELNAGKASKIAVSYAYSGVRWHKLIGQVDSETFRGWSEKENLQFRGDERYYLVREALSATKVTYSLDETLTSKLGGKATLDKYFQGELKAADSTSSSNYTLTADLIPSQYVCIKPQKLTVAAGVSGSQEYMFIDPDAQLGITETAKR